VCSPVYPRRPTQSHARPKHITPHHCPTTQATAKTKLTELFYWVTPEFDDEFIKAHKVSGWPGVWRPLKNEECV
jgi:hypothetical protein